MSLDYHLVDPLGDEEKDEQQSNVLDGCWSGGFGLKSWTRSAKSCQQLIKLSNLAWLPMPPWCPNELGLSSGRPIGRWWKGWAAIWCAWWQLIRRFGAEKLDKKRQILPTACCITSYSKSHPTPTTTPFKSLLSHLIIPG
jgi:hypothetical protein